MHVPLLFRRRASVLTILAVLAAATAYHIIGYYHSVTTFPIALAVFSVARLPPARRVSLACSGLAVPVLGFAQRTAEPEMRPIGAVVAIVIAVVAGASGICRSNGRGTFVKLGRASWHDCRAAEQRFDDLSVRLREDLTPSRWRDSIAGTGEQLSLPEVSEKAVQGLKFSAALPTRLAVATLAARSVDLVGAAAVLAEPVRFVSDH